jgi:Ca2+-binding RTX toxin-like protein
VGDDTQGERLRATAVYRHPDYDAGTLANDVGLIRLAAPATAGSPIALATAADAALFAPGVEATVVGWGETLGLPPGTPNEPAELREVRLPIISDQDCAAAYGGGFILPDMLCAGNLQAGGVDACYGDSGGPLFVAASSGYLQVGSVSGGFGCAEPGRPGLYARTATYQAWIISVISGAPPPEPPPVSGVMCRGRRANIVGTRGDDQLRGTDDDDVIAALGGDDVVWGLGGDDLICLGPGNDRAYGNAGDDIVRGAGGDDYVEGNLGADRLIGGAGVDTLIGGEGPDVVQGGGGGDIIHGLAGDDLLRGGPGDDALAGGPGSDVLYGGAGRDVLRGGEDRDTCYTGEDVVCESVAGPSPG